MPLVDASQVADLARIKTDICIIGAGAAGITLACALDKSQNDVCLIESGGFGVNDELQALYALDSVGYPVRANFMSRARYFGGSCNLWAGRSMKLCPIDLQKRDWVAHSGWPIGYEELDRYYPRARDILRLPAFESFESVGSPPALSADESALLSSGELQPAVALWATKPMRFGKVFRRQLEASRNVTTYTNANVTELVASSSGTRVKALAVRTLGGRRLTVEAGRYVLACGGMESARLLLVSRSQHAEGMGNSHDVVGRYFQDHPRAIFGRVRLARPVSLPSVLGMPVSSGKLQLGLRLPDRRQRAEGLLNSYVSLEPQLSRLAEQQYESAVSAAMILLRKGHAGRRSDVFRRDFGELRDMIYLLTPKEIMPHSAYRLYAWLKRCIRRKTTASHLTVINYCEQAPNPDSRVYLSDRRDALGMPTLVLDWRLGEQERASIRRLHDVLGQQFRTAGLGELETNPQDIGEARFTDASHHIGTLRMSSDPKSGVVDEHCKVHGMENLYVAGSAVFPTAGHANPTLTIIALVLRLRDRLQATID
ncbi:MAG: GMC oxidoreductase [Woeseiaceae bacterium]